MMQLLVRLVTMACCLGQGSEPQFKLKSNTLSGHLCVKESSMVSSD